MRKLTTWKIALQSGRKLTQRSEICIVLLVDIQHTSIKITQNNYKMNVVKVTTSKLNKIHEEKFNFYLKKFTTSTDIQISNTLPTYTSINFHVDKIL